MFDVNDLTNIANIGLGAIAGIASISLIIGLIDLIATWRVFKRMGQDPIYCIIPLARDYTFFKGTVKKPGVFFFLWILGMIVSSIFIPMYSAVFKLDGDPPLVMNLFAIAIALLAFMPIAISRICLPIVFGQSWVLGLLSLIIRPVYWIICFGNKEYVGTGKKVDTYNEYQDVVNGLKEISQEEIQQHKKETPEERKARREAERQAKLEEKKQRDAERKAKMEEQRAKKSKPDKPAKQQKPSAKSKQNFKEKPSKREAEEMLKNLDNMSEEEFMSSFDDSDYVSNKGSATVQDDVKSEYYEEPTIEPVEQEVPDPEPTPVQAKPSKQVKRVGNMSNKKSSIEDELDILSDLIK